MGKRGREIYFKDQVAEYESCRAGWESGQKVVLQNFPSQKTSVFALTAFNYLRLTHKTQGSYPLLEVSASTKHLHGHTSVHV